MTVWRSLRARLTAAFLLLAACALSVAATATALLVQQSSLGTLDTVLLEEATTLAGLVDFPPQRLAEAVRQVGREADPGPGKFVAVLDAGGAVLAASRPLPPRVARRTPGPLTAPRLATVGEDDVGYRVAWAPTATGGLVAVGIRASREVRFVRRARWGIVVLGALLLLVLGAGAWTITGRATRELDRLAREVATIEAGSLERRLSPRASREVDGLVQVLNRVLERLDRSVAQLRRFTADAAHELRTPLAAIRARLEVALCRDAEAVSREAAIAVLDQTDHLRRLAEDLLMLARIEGGAVRAEALDPALDLSGLVAEVAASLEPVAEDQGRPFCRTVAPGLTVRGSRPLLSRVLLNLLDNAFAHTPPAARVAVRAVRDGARAVIEVADDGPGIDPAVAPHVFERFHHGAGGGSGLGLAIVREIVDRHGGRVTLTSPPAGGTCVRVELARVGAARVPDAGGPVTGRCAR